MSVQYVEFRYFQLISLLQLDANLIEGDPIIALHYRNKEDKSGTTEFDGLQSPPKLMV